LSSCKDHEIESITNLFFLLKRKEQVWALETVATTKAVAGIMFIFPVIESISMYQYILICTFLSYFALETQEGCTQNMKAVL
jgi:hypothetical protein